MATSTAKIVVGVTCGILLAGLVLVGGCFACVGVGMVKQEEAKKKSLSMLAVQGLESETSYSRLTVTGRVQNNGNSSVEYVKVACDFLNSAGAVINTEWTFATTGVAIQPGAAKSFELSTSQADAVQNYRCYVTE